MLELDCMIVDYYQKFKQKILNWSQKHEQYLTLVFFTGGLVIDNLTLTRIDQLFDNLIILGYLFLASLGILFINLKQAGKLNHLGVGLPSKLMRWVEYLPLMTQFAFGGLFSAYVIFYTKSGTWTTSWIFLLIIYGIFIANERFRKRYEQLDFQISILFVALFSFLIFFIPVLLKQMGAWIFILSGLISLVLIYLFIRLLFVFASEVKQSRKKPITYYIFGIYLVFNFLYFTNIIPPVPLSMKEIGVYYDVQKTVDGEYLLRGEQYKWYEPLKKYFNHLKKSSSGAIYIYSSVFAPTDLNTDIVYLWQYYDENKKDWVVRDEVEYRIEGGREDGYRGYSFKTNLEPGKWRVDVVTESRQVLGKVKFVVNE